MSDGSWTAPVSSSEVQGAALPRPPEGAEEAPRRGWWLRWLAVRAQAWGTLASTGGLLEAMLIASAVGIFVLDVILPSGAAPELLYGVVVYLSLGSSRPRFPWAVTTGCTALTLAGAMVSPAGAPLWIDLANRFLVSLVLWGTLKIRLARREAIRRLQESHAEAEGMVRQRTADLSRAIESLQTELVQRARAERLLAESREQYRMLFEHAPSPMWVVDLDTLQFLDVNESAVRHYGYRREEFLAMTVVDIRPPEDVPRFLRELPVTTDGPRIPGNWRHRKKDGSVIDVELGVYSFDYGGRRARLAIVNDVTESKRLMEQLRASEERFRRIFEEAPIGIGAIGGDGRLLRVNEALCAMSGYTAAELTGKTLAQMTHPEDAAGCQRLLDALFEGTRHAFHLEQRCLTKTGRLLWGQVTVTAPHARKGTPPYALAMIEDVSERKRAEATRVRLLKKIMVAQEEERQRLARELHDGIGQILTGLAVGLRSLDDVPQSEQAAAQSRKLRQVAADAVDEVRRIARGLRPSVLDDLGLEEALRQFVRDYTGAYGIAADVHFGGERSRRLPNAVEIALYRIIQEAMTNAARHAGARHVSVVMERGPSTVTAIIEDDGCGFETDASASGGSPGLGIPGMRERAGLLSGTLEIESSSGKGTAVYVRIPVREDAS